MQFKEFTTEDTESTERILFDIFFVAFASFVVILFYSFPWFSALLPGMVELDLESGNSN
jgi:hypothetical protein